MCGGGGGGSGETKYNWNDTLAPKWQQLLGDAQYQAYHNPYVQYQGDRIAEFSPDQQAAMAAIRQHTARGGEAAAIAANNQAEKTAKGDYLTGPQADPWAGLVNSYSGYGPKFQEQLQGQLGDITNAYNQGTAADTTRMFNLSGAFGGSAHQNAVANNQAALAKALSQATANAYQTQFNQSAGLEENRMNRGTASYQGERNRMIGSLGAGQNTNAMFLNGVNALMGIGDAERGLTQDQLNLMYKDWQDEQNRNFQNADWLSGLYSRAQGGMSANSQFTQPGYSASPISGLLGAAMLYKGMGG